MADWPHWLLGALAIAVLIVGWKLNNIYFDWLHRRFPWVFRPIVLLAILAICVAVIGIGMWINPPSKVQADFQRAHPELFSKPAGPDFKTGH
jgi:phosphoglycerol transferase MdoB-like AlkP superfamily enzyme